MAAHSTLKKKTIKIEMDKLKTQNLVFSKCYCCSKNFNVNDLIELNNSVVFCDELVDFSDLLLDVCLSFIPTSTSYICEACKNQLIAFHLFKRDVKKYSSFSNVLPSLLILSKVEAFLNEARNEDVVNMQVFKREHEIVISSGNSREGYGSSFSETVLEEPCLEPGLEQLIQEPSAQSELAYFEEQVVEEVDEFEALEEYIDEQSDQMDTNLFPREIPQLHEEITLASVCTEEHQEDLSLSESSQKLGKRKKYKYPKNTNDKLSEQDRQWINSQVELCAVHRSNQTVYKCPICETILKIRGTFKKHLRDAHILLSDKRQAHKNDRQALKEEIQRSKQEVMLKDSLTTIWKCQRCSMNRFFRTEVGLKVHIRYNHIRAQKIDLKFIAQHRVTIDDERGERFAWKCPFCLKLLMSRDSFRNHVKREHPEDLESKKEETEMSFENSYTNPRINELQKLLETKKRTLKIDPTTTSCFDCGIFFISGSRKKEKSFRIHQELHEILSVVAQFYQFYKCNDTQTVFSNEKDLNTFLQSDQSSFKGIACSGLSSNICKKFQDPIGNAEDEEMSWKCGHCLVRYSNISECNAHIALLHSSKLICPVDFMEFEGSRGVSLFNIHMRNKHSEMFPGLVIACTYCQEEFTSVFEKAAHMKICDAKKFECDHCSKRFFTKTELLRHMRIVSGEISFICDICMKSCVSSMDLKLHRTSHTNLKLYPCSFPNCQKSFKTPAARSSHMEIHSSLTYDCSTCNSTFKQRTLLQRHIGKGSCVDKSKQMSRGVYEEICSSNLIP